MSRTRLHLSISLALVGRAADVAVIDDADLNPMERELMLGDGTGRHTGLLPPPPAPPLVQDPPSRQQRRKAERDRRKAGLS